MFGFFLESVADHGRRRNKQQVKAKESEITRKKEESIITRSSNQILNQLGRAGFSFFLLHVFLGFVARYILRSMLEQLMHGIVSFMRSSEWVKTRGMP